MSETITTTGDLKQVALLSKDGSYTLEDGTPLVPMIKVVQSYIDGPPMVKEQLYAQACSNDTITIESWMKTWVSQFEKNSEKFNFNENGAASYLGKEALKPVIIAGSGPSLKKNARHLKERGDIRIVSCLHNFGYLEDLGVMGPDDYYLTLDAGEITIPEVVEGGTKTADEYWARTKDRTLLAFVSTNPVLLEKWQGKVLFFLTPIANDQIMNAFKDKLDFSKVPVFNVGGNALGACLYFAKGILGGGSIIFIGADFSFDYLHKFHSWNSGYDRQFSGVVPCTDIFGNRVYSWQSYLNFKTWFEYIAMGGKGNNPQHFINCTEGGVLGAWPNGNIRQILQMPLKECLYMFNMYKTEKSLLEDSNKRMCLLF